MSTVPELLVDVNCAVGEGPSWEDRDQALLWVDLIPGDVYRLSLTTGGVDRMRLERPASAVLPRVSGGYVLTLPDGLYALGRIEQGAQLELLCPVESELSQNSINDAKCDPAGRLWAGTLARGWIPEAGSLYRIGADLSVTWVLGGTTISNGLGWSPDSTRMYFADSAPGTVDAFDYDVATGEVSRRRRFADLAADVGSPDGLCVDAEGGVWVAVFRGSAVHRYAPDGTLDRIVAMPTPLVTSCCFGGPDLAHLYVTTATVELPPDERTVRGAGALYVLEPGVQGLPTAAFGG